ncbi:unnamed protein product, partial [Sphagnum jensenii]
MMFGCSFTFGFLVDDQETLPSRLAQQLPDTRVYNYGMISTSIGDAVQRAKLISSADGEIREKSGTTVFLVMGDHYGRFFGSLMSVGPSNGRRANYRIDDSGHLAWTESIRQSRPIWTWLSSVLSESHILIRKGWDLPTEFEDTQWAAMVEAFKELKAESERLGSRRFIVAFWPEKQ